MAGNGAGDGKSRFACVAEAVALLLLLLLEFTEDAAAAEEASCGCPLAPDADPEGDIAELSMSILLCLIVVRSCSSTQLQPAKIALIL